MFALNTVEQWKQAKHPLGVIEGVQVYARGGLSFD